MALYKNYLRAPCLKPTPWVFCVQHSASLLPLSLKMHKKLHGTHMDTLQRTRKLIFNEMNLWSVEVESW